MGKIIRLILKELGHPQPPTPIHCDNSTCVGISNGTVKQQQSRSMEMRYFWIVDQVALGYFRVLWYPGLENLVDYFSKRAPCRSWCIWGYKERSCGARSGGGVEGGVGEGQIGTERRSTSGGWRRRWKRGGGAVGSAEIVKGLAVYLGMQGEGLQRDERWRG